MDARILASHRERLIDRGVFSIIPARDGQGAGGRDVVTIALPPNHIRAVGAREEHDVTANLREIFEEVRGGVVDHAAIEQELAAEASPPSERGRRR